MRLLRRALLLLAVRVEDNLQVYVEALADELARGPVGQWQSLPYVGVSLYEVPNTRLGEFRATRIRRPERAQTRKALTPLPIRIDELGIHDDVRRPFIERSLQKVRTTRFGASWHAEAMRSLVVAGDAVSASPWLDASYRHDLTALPAIHAYGILGVLAGQLRTEQQGNEPIHFQIRGNDKGLLRLETPVEPRDGVAARTSPSRAAVVRA